MGSRRIRIGLAAALVTSALAVTATAHSWQRSRDPVTVSGHGATTVATAAAHTAPPMTGEQASPAPRGSGQPSTRLAPKPYRPPKVRSSRTPQPMLTTAQPHPVGDSLDGCDNAYGTLDQCVPWTFPAGTRDGCRWLAAHGFGPLEVHGRDRHGLDRNGDGTACGPGD